MPGDTELGRVWTGWSWRDALSGWGAFIFLGVPGAVMATLDWASFEALAVITGLLGVQQLAAHTVLAQIGSLSFLVPYGIAVATSVRVGQAMGRGDASGAILSARVSWCAGIAWGALNFLLVVPTASLWPWAFTSDSGVARLATSCAWAVATFSVLDSLQQLNVGVLKGIGQQCVGMVVYPLAYLGVGLPLAFALAHPGEMGVAGVWLGETLGAAVAVVSLGGLLAFRYNWARLAETCRAQAAAG
jgi:MATE family multidrug resistance protein